MRKRRAEIPFKIANNLGNTLWAGSRCIEKFNIKVVTVYDVEIIDNKDAHSGLLGIFDGVWFSRSKLPYFRSHNITVLRL